MNQSNTEVDMPGREGPPGGSKEMAWAKCPECSGKGRIKDSKGEDKTCPRCAGKGQIQTR